MKVCLTTLVATTLLICASHHAQAQLLENNLTDVNAVLVAPELNLGLFDRSNFTTVDLKKIIEQKLTSAGIDIVPSQDKFNLKSDGILIVSIATVTIVGAPMYGYTVSLSLEENASSKRIRSPHNMMTITWEDQEIGCSTGQALHSGISSNLDTEMQLFINDYLKDNPKNTAT